MLPLLVPSRCIFSQGRLFLGKLAPPRLLHQPGTCYLPTTHVPSNSDLRGLSRWILTNRNLQSLEADVDVEARKKNVEDAATKINGEEPVIYGWVSYHFLHAELTFDHTLPLVESPFR